MTGGEQTPASGPGRVTYAPGRRRLWQLDQRFHCSVVGTCLSLRELRALAPKAGLAVERGISDYELHRRFVALADQGQQAAKQLQKRLDRKHRAAIRRFARAESEAGLQQLWQEDRDAGNVAGAYWALVTHPLASYPLLDQVYGEVHMLSHLAGASVRADLQELETLRGRLDALESDLAEARANTRARAQERNEALEASEQAAARAHAAEAALDAARARAEALEQAPLVEQLRGQIEALSQDLAGERSRAERAATDAASWQHLAAHWEDRSVELERQLASIRKEHDALKEAVSGLARADPCVDEADAADEAPHGEDLCGRCIAYVGGRSGQCKRLRELVEERNGRFLHHDGGCEEARHKLGAIVSRADAVFCPVDCVSHDAMDRVKRYCEQHAKRLVLLPRASLSAFRQGLEELAA